MKKLLPVGLVLVFVAHAEVQTQEQRQKPQLTQEQIDKLDLNDPPKDITKPELHLPDVNLGLAVVSQASSPGRMPLSPFDYGESFTLDITINPKVAYGDQDFRTLNFRYQGGSDESISQYSDLAERLQHSDLYVAVHQISQWTVIPDSPEDILPADAILCGNYYHCQCVESTRERATIKAKNVTFVGREVLRAEDVVVPKNNCGRLPWIRKRENAHIFVYDSDGNEYDTGKT